MCWWLSLFEAQYDSSVIRRFTRVSARSAGASRVDSTAVTWLFWLLAAAVIVAIAAVTGIKPRGTRPVARSRMMGVARVALVVIVVIFVYLAIRGR